MLTPSSSAPKTDSTGRLERVTGTSDIVVVTS